MDHRLLRAILTVLIAFPIAACGALSPSAAPAMGAGDAGTVLPHPTPIAVPVATVTATDPSGLAAAAIRVEPGEADGPGVSVREAIANAGIGPQLVNGILLREVDGSVWLCEVLMTSSPKCADPRLLVENRPEDQTFIQGKGLHAADGARWVENVQVFGTVHS